MAGRTQVNGQKKNIFRTSIRQHVVVRLDGILQRGAAAVDETTKIRIAPAKLGIPIGDNDSAIAGHALSAGAVLITNNVREFMRVPRLRYEDWTLPSRYPEGKRIIE